MKFVIPSFKIFYHSNTGNYADAVRRIEDFARVSHRSEDKSDGAVTGAESFVRKIIKLGHESVLEHYSLSVEIDCDRGVSHELVRHRIGSYTQESTRYVNYGDREIEFIDPFACPQYIVKAKNAGVTSRQIMAAREQFVSALRVSESAYHALIAAGAPPEISRAVLPNALRTKIVATYNLRQWREVLEKRTAKAAHPQMREIALGILAQFKKEYPVFFEDFEIVSEPLTETELGISGLNVPTHARRVK